MIAKRGSAIGSTLLLAASLLARPVAAAEARCSHDPLVFDGMTVNVTLCPTPSANSVAVAETFTSKTASFSHVTTIERLAGEDSSRGIDDVPLAPLGLTKSLHLAMRYKAGSITLEHALLLPGAISLK